MTVIIMACLVYGSHLSYRKPVSERSLCVYISTATARVAKSCTLPLVSVCDGCWLGCRDRVCRVIISNSTVMGGHVGIQN